MVKYHDFFPQKEISYFMSLAFTTHASTHMCQVLTRRRLRRSRLLHTTYFWRKKERSPSSFYMSETESLSSPAPYNVFDLLQRGVSRQCSIRRWTWPLYAATRALTCGTSPYRILASALLLLSWSVRSTLSWPGFAPIASDIDSHR